MIKCYITINNTSKGLILDASIPEAANPTQMETIAATRLKKKVNEWIDEMDIFGDRTSIVGEGAGADALRKMLEKEDKRDGQ